MSSTRRGFFGVIFGSLLAPVAAKLTPKRAGPLSQNIMDLPLNPPDMVVSWRELVPQRPGVHGYAAKRFIPGKFFKYIPPEDLL